MILVVLDHSGFPNRKVILGFHMPMLFVLSGYLNYRKDLCGGKNEENLLGYVTRQSKRLLIPYVSIEVINLVLSYVWSVISGDHIDFIHAV